MTRDAFYSDNDAFVCRWLERLIGAGRLPYGRVAECDINAISPAELGAYRECHFFAGIGGWPYALRLAGWPRDREVWTGSCPCQPLSRAGRRQGHADERHLWPAFYRLIAECRPATIVGEQVAGNPGCEWLSGVRADLEKLGYAIGAADLPAACEGAPHARQRLFWCASTNTVSKRRSGTSLEFRRPSLEYAVIEFKRKGSVVGVVAPLKQPRAR